MPIPNLLDGSAATLDGLSLVKPLEPMSDELSRTSDARICLETPLILGNRLANEDYSFVLEPRYIVRFKSCERLETSTPEPCYLGQPHVLDDGLASDDTQPMSTIVPLKPLPKLHPTDQSSPLPESMATSSAFCFCSDEGSKDSPSGPSSSHPKNMDEVKVSDHRTLSTNRQSVPCIYSPLTDQQRDALTRGRHPSYTGPQYDSSDDDSALSDPGDDRELTPVTAKGDSMGPSKLQGDKGLTSPTTKADSSVPYDVRENKGPTPRTPKTQHTFSLESPTDEDPSPLNAHGRELPAWMRVLHFSSWDLII
ncbi:hypothetical protein MMC28_003959 [Mycoblastus sanguinarius]|nr:hypothetical protein [Mycoblastus sanguinarius]